MAIIHELSSHLADLIAAGEVVERPSSVAKELVENAIDAGSTRITVEIENGGITYLRIADNGCGMAPEDAPIAFRRHATSKLRSEDDLAAIGTAETVHAATRGENITIIFINNAIYGMTGGQMAPTTLPGQVTTTSPYGRDRKIQGNPIRVCEMLSTLDGTALAARVSVDNPKAIMNAKKLIRKAFDNQLAGRGFSIVEVLSTCPTNWGMTPRDALQWLRDNMIPYYPLGVYKDTSAVEKEAE